MSGGSTEERKHPASEAKLRQLRRKGQIAVAQEFRAFLSLLVGLALLLALGSWLIGALSEEMVRALSSDRLASSPGAALFDMAARPHVLAVLAFAGMIVLVEIALAAIDGRGLIFSGKRLSEGLSRINPISNVKERFSVRTLVELARSLALTIAFVACAAAIVAPLAGDLFQAPFCGSACMELVLEQMIRRILAVAMALLLIGAAADYVVAHYFFRKQHRMTDTEVKRENRENLGSPELKQRLRELRQEILQGPSIRPAEAALALYSDETIFLIAYEAGQPGAPVVAGILKPGGMEEAVASLRASGKVVVRDDVAVRALASARRGAEIPEESFAAVAAVLRAYDMV